MADELTLNALEDQTGSTRGAEAGATDQSGQPQPSGAGQQTINAYTDDEVVALLDSDGKLDSNRLTPSQKLVQKSFEKHAQKLYQQLSGDRREFQQRSQQMGQPSIEQLYDQDPDGVIMRIDMAINQAKKEDPFSDKVIQLEALQRGLLRRDIKRTSEQTRVERAISSAQSEIRKDIPDFEAKREKLTEFATKELGLSLDEINIITDPSLVGPLAIKLTKAVNTLFDKINVINTTKQKEVKPTANQLERSSTTGSLEDNKGEDPGKWSFEKYKAERMAGRLK